MEVLLITVIAAANIICFVVGAKVGQTVSRGQNISLDPVKAVREQKARTEAYKEQDRLGTIMHNIESYDGSPNGQKDVPRG